MSELQKQIRQYCSYLHEWNASYEDYARSVGLSYTSLSILSALYGTENCTQKMLCESCFLPKQTVNTTITAFYKKGWVRLEELPEDRRNKTIHFTPEGQAAADEIMQRVKESEQKSMGALSESERLVLLNVTKRYVAGCKDAMKGL